MLLVGCCRRFWLKETKNLLPTRSWTFRVDCRWR
jgi:hypothetical protein